MWPLRDTCKYRKERSRAIALAVVAHSWDFLPFDYFLEMRCTLAVSCNDFLLSGFSAHVLKYLPVGDISEVNGVLFYGFGGVCRLNILRLFFLCSVPENARNNSISAVTC